MTTRSFDDGGEIELLIISYLKKLAAIVVVLWNAAGFPR